MDYSPRIDIEETITTAGTIAEKKFDRTIVRRSSFSNFEKVAEAVSVSFMQTHKDLETLLDMAMEVRFCSDLESTLKRWKFYRRQSWINFNVLMIRKSEDQAEDHLEALGSLRMVQTGEYPHPRVLHAVIHQIMMVGSVMHILI